MVKKILFLFIIVFSSMLIIISQAKYIKETNLTIAKINIDTITPKIELMNIKNISYKENENNLYDVIINIRVIESNIKENNIDRIRIKIDGKEIETYEINQLDRLSNEISYEIKIKRLLKNQKIQIVIPEGIIIDNANNKNEENIIEVPIYS